MNAQPEGYDLEGYDDRNDSLIAGALLGWYAAHHVDRSLPWRAFGSPIPLRAMVEGLLAQTRAALVAYRFDAIFRGINRYAHWLVLSHQERVHRVHALGLPALKAVAVTSIARFLSDLDQAEIDRSTQEMAIDLAAEPGIGPYTAGMVALLHGYAAAPIDTNVDRVLTRVLGEGGPWAVSGIVHEAMAHASTTSMPPGYEVVSAIMDLGALICQPACVQCCACPLETLCRHRMGTLPPRPNEALFDLRDDRVPVYRVARCALADGDWVDVGVIQADLAYDAIEGLARRLEAYPLSAVSNMDALMRTVRDEVPLPVWCRIVYGDTGRSCTHFLGTEGHAHVEPDPA